MKANRNYILKRDDRAEVGVGTLIVFIAMVLVAAVAAAVLINTSGTLQERATATGKEATKEVSSNFKVVGVYGDVTTGQIDNIRIHLELAAGARPIDMEQVIIRYSDGNSALIYDYEDGDDLTAYAGTNDGEWLPNWLRGAGTNSVMEPGDLVELEFALGAGDELDPRTSVQVLIIPESGAPVPADFTTPPTYGSDAVITLR